MKNKNSKILILVLFLSILYSCKFNSTSTLDNTFKEIYSNNDKPGSKMILTFITGVSHNHPLMAVWISDTNDNYLQTIYVANSIAKGVFNHGESKQGKWLPGAVNRPAALPFWGHQWGVKNENGQFLPSVKNPLPDAVTGATPKGNFKIISPISLIGKNRYVKVYFEINQAWDWNSFWSNDKFPEDQDYKSSSQPAIVYCAIIDLDDKTKEYELNPVGHSHYSGKDGKIYKDLSTITTALSISKSIRIRLEN